jgi:glycine C-acetyltransferase
LRFLGHLNDIEADGLYKRERLNAGSQGGRIDVASSDGTCSIVNLCSNNYLGLADHPDILAAAKKGLDRFGFGMASVRFICGAQTLHRELECAIARYPGKDDAILFAACFDANGGVFEPLLGPEDAIISDALNHASIIDGIRLSEAKRYCFASGDMNALESTPALDPSGS